MWLLGCTYLSSLEIFITLCMCDANTCPANYVFTSYQVTGLEVLVLPVICQLANELKSQISLLFKAKKSS